MLLEPLITCPSDISVVLKPGMSTADISDQWSRPTSNVNNVTAVSPPGVSGSYQFPYGDTIVRWVAVNEIGEHANCVVRVNVEGRSPNAIVVVVSGVLVLS